MPFLFDWFRKSNQENLALDIEPGEPELKELLKKIQTKILLQEVSQKGTQAFIDARKSKLESHSTPNFDQISDVVNNLQDSTPDLTPLFSSSSQSFEYQQRLIDIQTEYEKYINEPFLLENLKDLSDKEKISITKTLLKLLSIPRQSIRILIKFQKKRRNLLFLLLKVCFICFCCYQFMIIFSTIVTPFLISTFIALKEKISMERAKSKKKLEEKKTELDQIEESKGFWDKHLGYLSQLIKISRGGSLVPIREANIYEFSEFDQQQALLIVSSIPSYIKFERSRLELEKAIVDSQPTQSLRKRLRLKLKEFPLKLKNLSSNVLIIIFGITILMSVPNIGTPISTRNQNLINAEIMVPIQPSLPSVLQIFEPSIEETSRSIPSVLTKMKQLEKATSRLKSKNLVRKNAKLVRLSDLPPLPKQGSDQEIYSSPNLQPTGIKVH